MKNILFYLSVFLNLVFILDLSFYNTDDPIETEKLGCSGDPVVLESEDEYLLFIQYKGKIITPEIPITPSDYVGCENLSLYELLNSAIAENEIYIAMAYHRAEVLYNCRYDNKLEVISWYYLNDTEKLEKAKRFNPYFDDLVEANKKMKQRLNTECEE